MIYYNSYTVNEQRKQTMKEFDENFDDTASQDETMEIDFDVAADIDLDEEQRDWMLAQQELEDFAQDGYFENMEPMDDGFWG